MAFLVQMTQTNERGSVRNDGIFDIHLGIGVGPSISIPCLLQGTSQIYWFHLPKQLTRKKERIQNEIQLPTNCILLPWYMSTEPRTKKGRFGTQPKTDSHNIYMQEQGRNIKKESKSYHTVWTHMDLGTYRSRLGTHPVLRENPIGPAS